MEQHKLHCIPEPGSNYDVHLRLLDKTVTLYFRAYNGGASGLLQCWTNLPILSTAKDQYGWHAIDIGQCSERATDAFLVTPIELQVSLLEETAQTGRNLEFHVTYRLQSRDEQGQLKFQWLSPQECNGVICFHLPQLNSLKCLIKDLNFIDAAEIEYQSDDEALLSIPLDSSVRNESSTSFKLLQPNHPITVGAVWERTKSTWLTSRSFHNIHDISEHYAASLIALLFQDIDKVVVVLPVCTDTVNVSLRQSKGALFAKVNRFRVSHLSEYQVIVAIGPLSELHNLIRRCFRQLRAPVDKQAFSFQASPLFGSSGLGFCSWEALGAGKEKPSMSNMLAVLEKIDTRAPGSIATLLIDDGWQCISADGLRRLTSFDLDPSLIEKSDDKVDSQECTLIGQYIARLRSRFPLINNFGTWLTLAGYWGGLEPINFWHRYGPLVKAVIKNPFITGDQSATWWLPALDRLESFYDDYFTLLRESGITFVKVDDQADWDWIHSTDILAPSTYYDQAWQAMNMMAEKHFGIAAVIHSMAFGSLRFLTRQTINSSSLNVTRISDDTFPNVSASHTWHIYHSALNACLSYGNINILPDPDMITSQMNAESQDIDWADYHAAFRACFSTCTIWLSDGLERKEGGGVLSQLLAPVKDTSSNTSLGRLSTVQVSSPSNQTNALLLPSSVFENNTSDCEGPALKMSVTWTSVSKQVTGVLFSAFNTRYSVESIDCLNLCDVAQTYGEQIYGDTHLFLFSMDLKRAIVLDKFSHDFLEGRNRCHLTSKPLIPFRLGPARYCIFSFIPSLPVKQSKGRSGRIACVGLVDKYAGLMAVVDANSDQEVDTLISVKLSRAGKCGFLIHSQESFESENLSAQIDGLSVQKDLISMEKVDECILIVVDMISHLKQSHTSSKQFDENCWQLDLATI